MNKKNKNKKKKQKNKKKRTPAPPGNVRPNSFVPRASKGTHAGEGSLASTKCHCLYIGKSVMVKLEDTGGIQECKELIERLVAR